MGFDVVKAGIRKLTEPARLDRLITRVKQHPQSPRVGGRLLSGKAAYSRKGGRLSAYRFQSGRRKTAANWFWSSSRTRSLTVSSSPRCSSDVTVVVTLMVTTM